MKAKLVLIFLTCVIEAFAGNAYEPFWKGEYLTAIKLPGTPYERGYYASRYSGQQFEESMAGYMSYQAENISQRFGLISILNPIAKLATNHLFLKDALASYETLPEDDQLFIKGLADGYKVDLQKMKTGYLAPDYGNAMIGVGLRYAGKAPPTACSSFVAWGKLTPNGQRVIGRNLDYQGIDLIDKATSVYLLEPRSGGYRTLVVAPLGGPIPSVSGMNEKGLVLSLHTAITTAVFGDNARSIISTNREVLETASTIEEALEIYQKHTYLSGWMIHLSDRNTKTQEARSAIIEVSALGASIRWSKDDHSVLSNNYHTSVQLARQPYIAQGIEEHNRARENRLEDLVSQGKIDELRAIEILQDSYSPYSKTQVDYSPSAILASDQVNTMVFLPDELAVLVADGPAPSSFNQYRKFSFKQMEAGETPELVTPQKTKPSSAFYEYVRGTKAYVEDKNLDLYERHIATAHRLSKDCSFSLLLGTIQLSQNDMSSAEKNLRDAMVCESYAPHQKAAASYYLGIIQKAQSGNMDLLRKAQGLAKDAKLIGLINDAIKADTKRTKKLMKNITDKSSLDPKYFDRIFW